MAQIHARSRFFRGHRMENQNKSSCGSFMHACRRASRLRCECHLTSLAKDMVSISQAIPRKALDPRVHQRLGVHHEGVEVNEGATIRAGLAAVAIARKMDDLRLPRLLVIENRLTGRIRTKEHAQKKSDVNICFQPAVRYGSVDRNTLIRRARWQLIALVRRPDPSTMSRYLQEGSTFNCARCDRMGAPPLFDGNNRTWDDLRLRNARHEWQGH